MKNVLIAAGKAAGGIILLLCVIYTLVSAVTPDYKTQRIHDCITELDAYKAYYDAVETLLDSAGVDVDSPLLETDAGSNYLDAKMNLDTIYNANHHYGLRMDEKVVKRDRDPLTVLKHINDRKFNAKYGYNSTTQKE